MNTMVDQTASAPANTGDVHCVALPNSKDDTITTAGTGSTAGDSSTWVGSSSTSAESGSTPELGGEGFSHHATFPTQLCKDGVIMVDLAGNVVAGGAHLAHSPWYFDGFG